MVLKKNYNPPLIKKINGKRFLKTCGQEGGVNIFVQKRLFGFLWWVLIRDKYRSPITFNHQFLAEAYMSGVFDYMDQIHEDYKDGIRYVERLTDEIAVRNITTRIINQINETPLEECVLAAWKYEGRQYKHVAQDIAILWHRFYTNSGNKVWEVLSSSKN